MQLHCTRPGCPRPENHFSDLDDPNTMKTTQQKFCTACGMPLLLAGRYLPQRLLGQGGFGAAFLARDRYTPKMRECVVKQFQPSSDLTPDQIQLAQSLFEREAQVLEELGHRHKQIPDLLAFFELDVPEKGQPKKFFYLVQEFIDGQDMEQELAQKGKFSEKEMLDVLIEILKVLRFVHSNGSIHRDIKPSNIMRNREGLIYLLDFGAVRQVAAAGAAPSGRSTGIYSVGFAPPEQMQGNTVYPATDLYALGVTCISLLTGKEPSDLYDAYSNSWKWRSHTTVSDPIATVLDGMLRPTPSDRYQSAEEVLNAIKAALGYAPRPASTPAASSSSASTPSAPAPSSTKLQPAPVPQSAPQSAPPPIAIVPTPAFSTLELISNAAFTGFQGGMVALALVGFLGTVVNPLFWLILLGAMAIFVFAQHRRWIERVDLGIIALVSLGLVVFGRGFPQLQSIILVGLLAALMAIAITIMFRLIYLLLSRFF
jgi:serine/threonine protein kinase